LWLMLRLVRWGGKVCIIIIMEVISHEEEVNGDESPKPVKVKDKRIGNFVLGKTKGKGTFGKVKSGTHEPTGEKVSRIALCRLQ
jgi:SPX domain protein involved in polyphosphate accumulation